jgi:hypothetical protein
MIRVRGKYLESDFQLRVDEILDYFSHNNYAALYFAK